jgi:putative tryptophan/tyrosine transport system substrate-binding protein
MWAGLQETGFIIDKNVTADFQWAEDHYDRMPAMANELVRKNVSVILRGRKSPIGCSS